MTVTHLVNVCLVVAGGGGGGGQRGIEINGGGGGGAHGEQEARGVGGKGQVGWGGGCWKARVLILLGAVVLKASKVSSSGLSRMI